MNPISNEMFSHDAVKYVYQDPNVRVVNYGIHPHPVKPFEVKAPEKSKKTKKNFDKRKGQEKKGS